MEDTVEAGNFLFRVKELPAYMNPPQLSFTGHNVQLRHEYTAAGQLVPYFFQENRAVFRAYPVQKGDGST